MSEKKHDRNTIEQKKKRTKRCIFCIRAHILLYSALKDESNAFQVIHELDKRSLLNNKKHMNRQALTLA